MKLDFEKINYFRKRNGLSILGLCQLTGISRTTLWKWQNNKLAPSEKLIQKMCKALNVSISDISDIKESVPVSKNKLNDIIDSWLALTDLNSIGHQEEISNILDSIKNLNNRLNQSVIIIKALLDTMDTMFYIKDNRLKYLTANIAFLNNVSYDLENPVLGKDDFIFFSQEEARQNTTEDRKVFQTGKPVLRAERLIPGCRKTKWGIISKLPVFDSENKIVGIIGTFIDITERKKSEKNFKFIEQCLNSTSQIIIIIDGTKNQFVYISKRSFEAISGYKAEEVYETSAEEILEKICHPDDIHKFHRIVNWPETYTCEWRMRCADNGTKWIKMTVSHIWSEAQKSLHLIWTCTDITKEKEQDFLRVKTNQLLRNELLDISPKILWTARISETNDSQFYELNDISNRIMQFDNKLIQNKQYITIVDQSKYVYVTDDSFKKISGYSFNQLSKLSKQDALNKFCHPEDTSKHIINLKWPEIHTYEWRMIRADNQVRWIRTFKTHITDPFNEFLYSISLSQDITDIKNNKQANIQNEYSDKNEFIKSLIKYLWPYSELKRRLSFIHLSDEIKILTGYPKSTFTKGKRPLHSIIHPDHHTQFNSWLQTGKTPSDFNFKIITADNENLDIKTEIYSKQIEDSEILYYGIIELLQ